jgi:poly(3-hydroxybutyrate) depolymerase
MRKSRLNVALAAVALAVMLDMHSALLGVGGNKERVRSEHSINVDDGSGGLSTRYFVVRQRQNAKFVVLVLHPSLTIEDDDAMAAVRRFEDDIAQQAEFWAAQGAILVFLAGRIVGGRSYCWGAGTDNNLCTAPREGKEDESFLLSVLDYLKQHNSTFGTDSVPAYLYGHSGGGRMSWRIACNSTVAPRLSGVFVSSGLLPAELRGNPPACHLATMPPMFITHGENDKTTAISYADVSVAWASGAAKCSTNTTHTGVGAKPVARLVINDDCSNARPNFKIAYYSLEAYPHRRPPLYWFEGALEFWMRGTGPGFPGYAASGDAKASSSATKTYPCLASRFRPFLGCLAGDWELGVLLLCVSLPCVLAVLF